MKTNPRVVKSLLSSSIVLTIIFGLSICSTPNAVAEPVTISRSVLSQTELRETIQAAQADYKAEYEIAQAEALQAELDRINDPNSIQSKFVKYAKSFEGTPYWYGGSTPRGFDCSGFVSYVIKHELGIKVRHSASSIMAMGPRVSKKELLPGDLVGWGWGRYFHHIGIYIGDGKVIDALNPYRDTDIRKLSDLNSWLGKPTFVRIIEVDRNFNLHDATLLQMQLNKETNVITFS